MSRRSQNPWMPEAKTGVNYFKHTKKHFLTPYGKTHGALTNREILDKMFHWNCEWLTRPNYAVSELADTLILMSLPWQSTVTRCSLDMSPICSSKRFTRLRRSCNGLTKKTLLPLKNPTSGTWRV